MTSPPLRQALAQLARQVATLSPNWTRPERFYTDRDNISDALHRLAHDIEGNPR